MKKLHLKEIPTSARGLGLDKEDTVKKTHQLQKEMYDLLYLMFAHNRYSLLIILHGIDASGKDGTVRHVFSGANPQGLRVFSFKRPSEEELKHDFLWRCHRHTPESGLTTLFNRSYYEEVTTVRVHPEYLQDQHIPEEIMSRPDFFDRRLKRINDFEKLLTQKGTLVLKLFLHISKKEQKIRIEERLKNPSRNWKFSEDDVKERKHWAQYMESYQKMLDATHTHHAPWTVIPADDKGYRDYLVSKAIVESLRKLKMSFPKVQDQDLKFK